jgi:hypothetical protein
MKLEQACKHFSAILKSHEDLAKIAIRLFLKDCDRYGPEETQFSRLTETICAVERMAGDPGPLNWVDELDEVLPRKMAYRKANEVFCIRYVVNDAIFVFGKPFYKEVGILVSVMLDRDEEISPDRVKEIWKDRMWRDSERPM